MIQPAKLVMSPRKNSDVHPETCGFMRKIRNSATRNWDFTTESWDCCQPTCKVDLLKHRSSPAKLEILPSKVEMVQTQ